MEFTDKKIKEVFSPSIAKVKFECSELIGVIEAMKVLEQIDIDNDQNIFSFMERRRTRKKLQRKLAKLEEENRQKIAPIFGSSTNVPE